MNAPHRRRVKLEITSGPFDSIRGIDGYIAMAQKVGGGSFGKGAGRTRDEAISAALDSYMLRLGPDGLGEMTETRWVDVGASSDG